MKTNKEILIDLVLDQIIEDVRETYDVTAIEEMIKLLDDNILFNYLSEERQIIFKVVEKMEKK